MTWLVIKDTLATGRKLLNRGYKGEVKCVFCRYGIKYNDHFFFFFFFFFFFCVCVGSVVEFGSMLWVFVTS